MRIRNCEQADVDIHKLRDYILNTEHERGKHKARLFRSAMGITSADAEWLMRLLLEKTCDEAAQFISEDEFGERYRLDFEIETGDGIVTIRSGWIVRRGEDFPRLTTCYVLKETD